MSIFVTDRSLSNVTIVDLCHVWLCWSLWPVTMLIFISSFSMWLCWYLSASLLGAMTGRVKCGTRPRGRSYTPWRATAMWCMPLHSTIHMGKTFKHLKATLVTKIHKVWFLSLKHTWDESIPYQGIVRETSMLMLQMKMFENVKSENYKWRCWKC